MEKPTELGHTAPRRRLSAEDLLEMQLAVHGLSDGWVREHKFLDTRRFRFDFANPALKLAVEIDGGAWIGGRHTRGLGIESDHEKQNLAVLAGWRVLRFTPRAVNDRSALQFIHGMLLQEATCARHDRNDPR